MKNRNLMLYATLVLFAVSTGCASTKKGNDPNEITKKALGKLNYPQTQYHLFLLPGTDNVDATVRINEEPQWVELIQSNVAAVRVDQKHLNQPVKILIVTKAESGLVRRYEKTALTLDAAPQIVKAFIEETVK